MSSHVAADKALPSRRRATQPNRLRASMLARACALRRATFQRPRWGYRSCAPRYKRYGAYATTSCVRRRSICGRTAASLIRVGDAGVVVGELAAAPFVRVELPGEITRFAPSRRNSCVSLRSTSNSRFNSAEITAAPLITATSATVRRPRLPRSNFQSRRPNITRPAESARDRIAPPAAGESGCRSQPPEPRFQAPPEVK